MTKSLFLRAKIALAVGWFIRMVEDAFTTTAWGGPFTILIGWVAIVFLSIIYVGAAIAVGQLVLLPTIGNAWTRAGYWTLLLAVPPVFVLLFSSSLGLRTIDPVSNFSMMSLETSSACYFLIVFPFANLPAKHKVNSPSSPSQP